MIAFKRRITAYLSDDNDWDLRPDRENGYFICGDYLGEHVSIPHSVREITVVFAKEPTDENFELVIVQDEFGKLKGQVKEHTKMQGLMFTSSSVMIKLAVRLGFKYAHIEY